MSDRGFPPVLARGQGSSRFSTVIMAGLINGLQHLDARNGVNCMIEIDGPFCRVNESGFEMLIPRWEGHEPETAEEADATIIFPDGSRRYATFMTLDVVRRLMDKDARTGESSGGRYFWCSDLIIIRNVGFESMAAAIRDLISSGDIEGACGLIDPPDEDDEETEIRKS